MSAVVLFHHVAKRRLCAHAQQISCNGLQRFSTHVENGEQKREETNSTLVYKSSAYYQTPMPYSPTFNCSRTGNKFPYNPPSRQQRNPYRFSISQRLTRSLNTLANQEPTPNPTPTIVINPRSFQRCRPDYLNMTHDISQRLSTLDLDEALLVLTKVTAQVANMGPSEITSFLCKLSQISLKESAVVRRDTRFNMLLRCSMEIMGDFTTEQLLDILRAFLNLALPRSHSILSSLESAFCLRVNEMNVHQLLLAADLWRCLVRSVPQYLEKAFDKISQDFEQMGPAELVQLIYITGESRGCPNVLVKPLKLLLMRHVNELKAEELGVVCLGLFKAQINLTETVVLRLVNSSLANIKEMSDFGIANVMKYLRFCYLDHLPWLEAMGVEVPRRAPQLEAQGLMHIILGFSSLHVRDDRVLFAVAKRLPDVVDQCRSKDAAKMLWAFGNLGIVPSDCPDLYPTLTSVLRERLTEFQRFPEHLLTGLLGLAFVGLFPEDLLNVAFSEDYVDRACKIQEFELTRDLLTLDGTVGLELPESTVPRLRQALREEVTKQLWDFAKSEICQKIEVLEAESMLQKLLGGEAFVRKCMILPHLRSIDLEVHLNQDDKPISFHQKPSFPNSEQRRGVSITDELLSQLTNAQKNSTDSFKKPLQHLKTQPAQERDSIFSVGIDLTDDLLALLTKSGRRSTQPKASVKKLAVQVTNRNQYCYRRQQLLGLHRMKRRQLELAGYKVVELPYWEWLPLLRRSHSEKLAYLHCKIFSDT